MEMVRKILELPWYIWCITLVLRGHPEGHPEACRKVTGSAAALGSALGFSVYELSRVLGINTDL